MENCASVVSYKDDVYLLYSLTTSGRAKLLRPDLSKFSGTPGLDKLKVLKNLDRRKYNGHYYCKTKQGIISMSTGNLIVDDNITLLFN